LDFESHRLLCRSESRQWHHSRRVFYPFSVDVNAQDDEVWHNVGKGIGNLQALGKIEFSSCYTTDDDDDDENDDEEEDEDEDDEDDLPTLDWEILARILSQV
jgi:hypothetical protein